jgi:hypothetical protein
VHVTLALHTQHLIILLDTFLVEDVRIAEAALLVEDVEEVGGDLGQCRHIIQDLSNILIDLDLQTNRLLLSILLERVYHYVDPDRALEIDRISQMILECRRQSHLILHLLIRFYYFANHTVLIVGDAEDGCVVLQLI